MDENMAVKPNIQEPPTPREYVEKRRDKEAKDVANSLLSIENCIKGIIEKKEKADNATTKVLRKKYLKQVKASEKYLEGLYDTLKLEQFEAVAATIAVDRLVD